jgi:hypothetical protein
MRLKWATAISGDWFSVKGAALGRHAGDPRRFQAAVGPHAVDDRQPPADLVLRDVEHPALLVECAGGDFRGVGVDGDGGNALGGRHVAQVTAEALLVDRKVIVERQQHGRDDAVRDVLGVTGHVGAPRRDRSAAYTMAR